MRSYNIPLAWIYWGPFLVAIPAVLTGLVVPPLAAGAGSLGRRIIGATRQRSAGTIAASATGIAFWVLVCGLDWRWLPLAVSIVVGLAAMTPPAAVRPDFRRSHKILAAVAVAGCCIGSAIGTVALLSNSPSRPEWSLSDYQPADALDLQQAEGDRVLLDERQRGSAAMSFEPAPATRSTSHATTSASS